MSFFARVAVIGEVGRVFVALAGLLFVDGPAFAGLEQLP
jgi:hypothetical protein